MRNVRANGRVGKRVSGVGDPGTQGPLLDPFLQQCVFVWRFVSLSTIGMAGVLGGGAVLFCLCFLGSNEPVSSQRRPGRGAAPGAGANRITPDEGTSQTQLGAPNETRFEILDRLLRNYNKYDLPPPQRGGGGRIVRIVSYIKDVFDISEVDSSVNVRYRFKLTWNDTRLQFEPFMESGRESILIKVPIEIVKQKGEVDAGNHLAEMWHLHEFSEYTLQHVWYMETAHVELLF